MRILFIILLIIHGLIHMIGFVKALEIAPVEQLQGPISKQQGYFWGLAAALFILTAALYYLSNELWWLVGLLSVITSQWLIILHWQDARFGTLANLVVLVIIIIGMAGWSFDHKTKDLVEENILSDAEAGPAIRPEQAEGFPEPVRRWLNWSNIYGRKPPASLFIQQNGELRLSPESGNWLPFRAEQWVTFSSPGFLWSADAGSGMMFFRGRDMMRGGNGSMLIKAYGIYPVVDAAGDKIDQGTMVRYLAEMIWYPWAAVAPYIKWEEAGENSAKASIHWGDTGAFGIFHFDEMGRPVSFEAKRYYNRDNGYSLENWIITIDEESYESFDGIMVPRRSKVKWELETGDFEWLELSITDYKMN